MLLPCSPCCGGPIYNSCVNQNLNDFIFDNQFAFRDMQFSVSASITGGYPGNVAQFSLPRKLIQVPGTSDGIREDYENIEYTYGDASGSGVIGGGSIDIFSGTTRVLWAGNRQALVNPNLPGFVGYEIRCTDKRTASNPDDFEFLVTLTADFIAQPGFQADYTFGFPSVHFGQYSYSGAYIPDYFSPPIDVSLVEYCQPGTIYIMGVPSMTYQVSMNVPQACSFLANLLNGVQAFGFANHPVGAPLPEPLVVPSYSGVQTYLVEPEKKEYRTLNQQTGLYGLISTFPNPCQQYDWPDASLPDSVFGQSGQFYATLEANLSPAP